MTRHTPISSRRTFTYKAAAPGGIQCGIGLFGTATDREIVDFLPAPWALVSLRRVKVPDTKIVSTSIVVGVVLENSENPEDLIDALVDALENWRIRNLPVSS